MNAPRSYLPSLDAARGLAILLVIAHNVEMIDSSHLPRGWLQITEFALNIGWIGVILFFVLSGYLITGILMDTRGRPHALRNFIARRALRIFPLYYGLLAVVYLLLPALGLQPPLLANSQGMQAWYWTYTVNWAPLFRQAVPDALPHLWSLGVEEQFYLLWPLLVLPLRSARAVAGLCLAVVGLSVGVRWAMVHQGVDPEIIYHWTLTRIDALAMGGLAAALVRWPAGEAWVTRHRLPLAAWVSGTFLCTFLLTHGMGRTSIAGMSWGYAVWALLFAYLVHLLADIDQGRQPAGLIWQWSRLPGLAAIGQVSYGMYIFHKPLHDLYGRQIADALHLPAQTIWGELSYVALIAALAYGLAWLSYQGFERHVLKLKRHFA